VRTAGTESLLARRNHCGDSLQLPRVGYGQSFIFNFHDFGQLLRHHVGIDLAHGGESAVNLSVKSFSADFSGITCRQHLDIFFHKRQHFFHHHYFTGQAQIFFQQFFRQRPGAAEFQYAYTFLQTQHAHRFPAVKETGAAGNDQNLRFWWSDIFVERTFFKKLSGFFYFFLLEFVFDAHRRADYRPFERICQRPVINKARLGYFGGQFAADNIAAGVRHARDRAQHNDIMNFFGKLKRPFG